MKGRRETIAAEGGGAFSAYVAEPSVARALGLVLLQYISGVNRVMRALADGFAREGFLVACPDLFWRQEPGVELDDDPARPDPVEQKRALAPNAGFADDPGMRDVGATLAFLRRHPRCTGKVGALGHCLEFPSAEAAMAFYSSAEYTAALRSAPAPRAST